MFVNSKSSPTTSFFSKKDFSEFKKNLGKEACNTAIKIINKYIYSTLIDKSVPFNESMHVVQITLTLENGKGEVDFYADKFLSDNLPKNYDKTINQLTRTQTAALNTILKECIKQIKDKPKIFGNLIKTAENIKSLKDSSVLKVIVYKVLRVHIWREETLCQLCDEINYKKWA